MNKVLSLLGLAFRSGNLVSGEFATREAVRKKAATLVIVANDASDNTKKMFANQCKHYQVPFYCGGLKEFNAFLNTRTTTSTSNLISFCLSWYNSFGFLFVPWKLL